MLLLLAVSEWVQIQWAIAGGAVLLVVLLFGLVWLYYSASRCPRCRTSFALKRTGDACQWHSLVEIGGDAKGA